MYKTCVGGWVDVILEASAVYIQLNDGKNSSKMHTYFANWNKSPDPENCSWQLTKAVNGEFGLDASFHFSVHGMQMTVRRFKGGFFLKKKIL